MIGRIYTLVIPLTLEPIYVGSTFNSLRGRLSVHVASIKNGTTKLCAYLRENNIIPDMMLLEEVSLTTKHEIYPIERKYILELRGNGANLLNTWMPSKTNIPSKYISVRVSKKSHGAVCKYLEEYGNGEDIGKFYDKAAMDWLAETTVAKNRFTLLDSNTLICAGWVRIGGSTYNRDGHRIVYTGTEWLHDGEILTEQNYLEKIK